MNGTRPLLNIFMELDRAQVPEAWLPDLSDTLLQVGAAITPVDRAILAPLVACLARHSGDLKRQAGVRAPVIPPTKIYVSHPACATLFRYRHGRPEGLELLTAIGLCSLLEAGKEGRGHAERMLTVVRGALEMSSSPLSGALGAISSIPELVRIVDTDLATRSGLPSNFLQLWDAWLRDTLVRWMLAEPRGLRHALELRTLSPQLEDPRVPVSEPEEAESGLVLQSTSVPASSGLAADPTTCRLGRAASDRLERESIGDLMAPPELRLPRELDERLCRLAVSQANELLETDHAQAERCVALALSLGGGIREIDLRGVVWGGEADADALNLSVDPDVPVLYRRLRRPPNAVRPSDSLALELEPTTDVFAWPLPTSVHDLLLRLAGGAAPKLAVLPLLGSSAAPPYHLRDVITQLVPEAKVGALAPREALASEMAAALGSELAQLAMADTFGMVAVPAYYSAMPESDLAAVIAGIQSRRFDEQVPVPSGRPAYVGSRLVLTDLLAKRWPGLLREAMRQASRQPDDVLAQWPAHRDSLTAALCSGTGHRTEDALGRIYLGDVIPEYGLILLQDKQVDALRATRIAATGRLWLADLRRFLDRLIQIASRYGDRPEGQLAAAILRNDEPLFSVPGEDGAAVPMTAAALRTGMPQELREVDNFFRHRLDQRLLARRVDPELRHGQLGWVVSPAHLHADLSPCSPIDLGARLGPVIDELLVADGWYLSSARKTRWTWDGIPMPPPIDWDAVFASQKRQQEEELKRIRAKLRERWKALEESVLSRLGAAFQQFCPLLRVDTDKKCLAHTLDTGVGKAITLGADHHALICDQVRQGDEDPSSGLEAVMARILLYRMVRRAREKGLVEGPIPSRPFLSATSDPSPFVPNLGIAVRHAFAIREGLQARASSGRTRDMGPMAVWAVMAFSMYRHLPWAQVAVGAAQTAVRAKGRPHVVRTAARIDGGGMHMVFSGAPAALLLRRKRLAPTSPAPSAGALEKWALSHLAHKVDWGGLGVVSARIERTLAAAAHVELSGIERCLFRAAAKTAADAPVRCIARDDGWPVQTAELVAGKKEGRTLEPPIAEANPTREQRDQRRAYLRLIELLNKRAFGRRRAAKAAKSKQASDGNRGWRRALRTELERLREEVGSESTLAVLIGYVLNHLRYGSENGNSLSQNSLRREVTQVGWPLIVQLAERKLLDLPAEELHRIYREILLSKSSHSRRYAFEELQRFQRYLSRIHARPSVDMGELASLAGSRPLDIEPGLLTEAECRAVLEELKRDYETEAKRPDASPEFLRIAQLRLVLFLILEASGIRTGSANGLTLSDVHVLGETGDFVHIRKGDYAEAKTSSSLGFAPLSGPIWVEHRAWLRGWILEQRALHPEVGGEAPLFAVKAGQRTRVSEHHLTGRINALLKWASGQPKAHCHWLRKARITERFHAVAQQEQVSARTIYGLLVASGHAWIDVTIERYVNDPAAMLFAEMRAAGESSRAVLLAMSGLEAGPVDAAWNRADAEGVSRVAIVLDRLGVDHVAKAPERRTDAPALRRFKSLLPMHVDAYARAMQRHRNGVDAALEAGITLEQAILFDSVAADLLIRRGHSPWGVSERGNSRTVLPVGRRLEGTENWFSLLEEAPSDSIKVLADCWVEQPHAQRLYGDDILMRIDATHAAAVRDLITKTGMKLEVLAREGRYLLREASPQGSQQGHGAALRWVLSVIWIYNCASHGLRGEAGLA